MIYRLFAVISFSYILYFSSFSLGDVEHIVHAYRKPSEADIRWLFGDAAAPIPVAEGQSSVVQAGYITSKIPALVPHCEPCKPAQLPKNNRTVPSIPPAPIALNNRTNFGLAPDEEGVTNIASTIADSPDAVLQMGADRLPPPTELPKNDDVAVLPAIPPTDHSPPLLPTLREKGRFPAPPIFSETVSGCGTSTRSYHNNRNVPSMIGSGVWFGGYSVGTSGTFPTEFTLPTMLRSRPNAVEHFNAQTQNRIWADYRTWNNAASIDDASRSVEQFSFGVEKQLMRRNSVELRVPVIYQFASDWLDDSTASAEFGNISVYIKQVLLCNPRWTVAGGGGVSLPTAEDWQPFAQSRLNNSAYNVVSFIGAQWHPNRKSFGHFVLQADMPMGKNELTYNTNSAKIKGEQVIRSGIQLGRWFYRIDHGWKSCRLGAFAEVNYAVVTAGSAGQSFTDGVNGVYVEALNARRSTLTAAVGLPMVFGKLTCTNSLTMPISGGNQPFSVGYNFSLSRQF